MLRTMHGWDGEASAPRADTDAVLPRLAPPRTPPDLAGAPAPSSVVCSEVWALVSPLHRERFSPVDLGPFWPRKSMHSRRLSTRTRRCYLATAETNSP